jgi:hypothetical protein
LNPTGREISGLKYEQEINLIEIYKIERFASAKSLNSFNIQDLQVLKILKPGVLSGILLFQMCQNACNKFV